MQTKHISLYPG